MPKVVRADEMPTETTEIEVTEVPTKASQETFTNWGAFEQAGLNPKSITCEGYWPFHMVNNGCHTTIVPTTKGMIAHLEGDHTGGFCVKLAQTDKKLWSGWQDLKDNGIELADLRCGVCGQELKLTAQTLLKHLRPHISSNRRMTEGGMFYMTISRNRPEEADEEV